jgi:hypothetical protein
MGFAEMSFSVALQVYSTKLDVAGREQALGDGQETGKIVVHENQDTPQAALDQWYDILIRG